MGLWVRLALGAALRAAALRDGRGKKRSGTVTPRKTVVARTAVRKRRR
jgi:hypothetical protein